MRSDSAAITQNLNFFLKTVFSYFQIKEKYVNITVQIN